MAKLAWLAKCLDEVHVICERADGSSLMLPHLATATASAQLCFQQTPRGGLVLTDVFHVAMESSIFWGCCGVAKTLASYC